jgi:hypothetical protein
MMGDRQQLVSALWRVLSQQEKCELAVKFLKETITEYECVCSEGDKFCVEQSKKAQEMIDELEQFWCVGETV